MYNFSKKPFQRLNQSNLLNSLTGLTFYGWSNQNTYVTFWKRSALMFYLVESGVFLRHASHSDGTPDARELRLVGREEGAVVKGCASSTAGVVLPVATYYRFVLPHLTGKIVIYLEQPNSILKMFEITFCTCTSFSIFSTLLSIPGRTDILCNRILFLLWPTSESSWPFSAPSPNQPQ